MACLGAGCAGSRGIVGGQVGGDGGLGRVSSVNTGTASDNGSQVTAGNLAAHGALIQTDLVQNVNEIL